MDLPDELWTLIASFLTPLDVKLVGSVCKNLRRITVGAPYIHPLKLITECVTVNVLVWMRSKPYPCMWSSNVVYMAAKKGRFDIVKWAVMNGCEWDARACSAAANGGHISIVKWLVINNCPWNSYACVCAAKGGHVSIFKYLRDQGCPWTRAICYKVAATKEMMDCIDQTRN